MTAPTEIDPARCLELASWAREVAQVTDAQVTIGGASDDEARQAKARTRENMAAIADQLTAAAGRSFAESLESSVSDALDRGRVPMSGLAPLDALHVRGTRDPAISHDFLPPLAAAGPPTTTEQLRALQAPGIVSQPRSIPNDGPAIVDLVISDLLDRAQHGEAKYGVRLQPNNGRVALVDLYQELLDAAQYVRQEIEERRAMASWRREPPTVDEVRAWQWWWYRAVDGGTVIGPAVLQLDVDNGIIVDANDTADCPGPFDADDWGNEWAPCCPPRSP